MVESARSGGIPSLTGGMAERSKAAVLKTAVGSHPPGVRIPLPPPGEVPERPNGVAC